MQKHVWRFMKLISNACFALLLIGCVPEHADNTKTPIKAIYLVRGNGQITSEDLRSYPEVIVTDNFDELKEFAKAKVSLWVDVNAVDLVDMEWLGENPQKYYPVAVVGNSKADCVFFYNLNYFHFEAPPPGDENYCKEISPGFSVNLLKKDANGNLKGIDQVPTVQSLLDITNPLLETIK